MFFNSKILIANDNKHHYDCKVQSYIYIYIYIYIYMRFSKVYLCNNDKILIYIKLDKV